MQLNFKQLGQGPPLVMLHGLFGSSDNWMGVAPKFASQFQIFLLDLRNHGLSSHSDEMNYSVMADDIAEFLDAQHLERAHVLGHSLGGKTAMHLALNFPDRVDKLVIVDMSPRAYPPDHNKIFAALLALDLKKFQSRREMEDVLAPDIPDLTLRRFLLKNLKSQASSSGAQTFEWKINFSGLFKNYPTLLEPLPPQVPFPKPSLFLYGGLSDYVSENDAPLIHKFFPQAKMEVIAQARHWVHTDAPEEFVRRISVFLSADS